MYALRPQNIRPIRIRLLPVVCITLSLLGFGFSAAPKGYFNIDNAKAEAYINKYLKFAEEEREVAGIPIAIKLAQAMIESAYGESELAKGSNNHFGITCKRNWTGYKYTYTPELGGKSICFRKYSSVREAYKDHSAVLGRVNYAQVRKLPATDYKGWAYGIKAGGYAEDKDYANKLIGLIERLNLSRFDIAFEKKKQEEKVNTGISGNQIVIRNIRREMARMQHYERIAQEQQSAIISLREDLSAANYRLNASEAARVEIEKRILTVEAALKETQRLLARALQTIDNLRRGQLDLAQRQSDIEDQVAKANQDPFYTVGMPLFPEGARFPLQKADSRGVFYINGRQVIAANGTFSLSEYGTKFSCSSEDLVRFNDLEKDAVLPKGYYIFLEPKRNTNSNAPKTHQVKEGETMHSIAALYGLRLHRLFQRNDLEENEEPAVNEHLFLNGKNPSKPAVKSSQEVGSHQRFINCHR